LEPTGSLQIVDPLLAVCRGSRVTACPEKSIGFFDLNVLKLFQAKRFLFDHLILADYESPYLTGLRVVMPRPIIKFSLVQRP
jgi:hypothetical protein